ncbi:adenosine receptor A2a [Ischnura elegans]|uniref:adenosine receptor A2a n=1 Tax=Ischnura elegans TaxID=197161 RepID=UPI001ED8A0E2|nr:adenosine receptor A2a [Ischnura elegans]
MGGPSPSGPTAGVEASLTTAHPANVSSPWPSSLLPLATDFPDALLETDTVYELNVPYATCEVLVAIAAVAGNGLVLAAFRRERRLRRRTNYYIVSLAAADLLVGLLGIPVAVLASVGLPSGLYACLLAVCLLVVLCTISIFCLVAVSVDRYWAILHPMAYSRNVRTKTAVSIICVCWVAGTFVGFLPLLGWNAGPQQRCRFTEVMDYNYLVFLYFATIIVPALILAAFYAHIYRVVLRQLRQMVTMDAGPRSNPAGREGSGTMLRMLGAAQRREVKATQNLAIIVLFFILCWIPLYTINCVKAFCPACSVEGALTDFCIILSHLNSALNPLLYAYHLRDFRAALRAIFGGAKRRRMQRHKFLHLNEDGPGITHAASAPAAIRAGNDGRKTVPGLANRQNVPSPKPQQPEIMPHISVAAVSSTRCLVAAAGYPEALSPEALRDQLPCDASPQSPRRMSSPPALQRVMSEGTSEALKKRVSKRPRTSAASCPEASDVVVRAAYSSGEPDDDPESDGEEGLVLQKVSGHSVGGLEGPGTIEDEEQTVVEENNCEVEGVLEEVIEEERVMSDQGEEIAVEGMVTLRTVSGDVQEKCNGYKDCSPANGALQLVEGDSVAW